MEYESKKSYKRVKDIHKLCAGNRLDIFMSCTTEKQGRNFM